MSRDGAFELRVDRPPDAQAPAGQPLSGEVLLHGGRGLYGADVSLELRRVMRGLYSRDAALIERRELARGLKWTGDARLPFSDLQIPAGCTHYAGERIQLGVELAVMVRFDFMEPGREEERALRALPLSPAPDPGGAPPLAPDPGSWRRRVLLLHLNRNTLAVSGALLIALLLTALTFEVSSLGGLLIGSLALCGWSVALWSRVLRPLSRALRRRNARRRDGDPSMGPLRCGQALALPDRRGVTWRLILTEEELSARRSRNSRRDSLDIQHFSRDHIYGESLDGQGLRLPEEGPGNAQSGDLRLQWWLELDRAYAPGAAFRIPLDVRPYRSAGDG